MNELMYDWGHDPKESGVIGTYEPLELQPAEEALIRDMARGHLGVPIAVRAARRFNRKNREELNDVNSDHWNSSYMNHEGSFAVQVAFIVNRSHPVDGPALEQIKNQIISGREEAKRAARQAALDAAEQELKDALAAVEKATADLQAAAAH